MSFISDELDLVPALQNRVAELETLLADVRATNREKDLALDAASDKLLRALDDVNVLTVQCAQLRHAQDGTGMIPEIYLEDLAVEMAHQFSHKDDRHVALDYAQFTVRNMVEYWHGMNRAKMVPAMGESVYFDKFTAGSYAGSYKS